MITPDGVAAGRERRVQLSVRAVVQSRLASDAAVQRRRSRTTPISKRGSGRLRRRRARGWSFRVDGKTAAELVLDPGAKDVALRVPLSVGEHEITLENLGDDWLELDYLEIGQFVDAGARC